MSNTFRACIEGTGAFMTAQGVAALMFDWGSADASEDDAIYVHRIAVNTRNRYWNASLVNFRSPTDTRVVRISAYKGGRTVAAVKTDTNYAAMPSQVVFSANPYTITAGNILRTTRQTEGNTSQAEQLCDQSNFFQQFTTNHTAAGWLGAPRSPFRGAYVWKTTGLLLQAGEGVALQHARTANEVSAPAPFAFFDAEMTVRVVATGAIYQYRTSTVYLPNNADDATLVLLNGSGSGVVLEILSIALYIGHMNIAAGNGVSTQLDIEHAYSLALIEGIRKQFHLSAEKQVTVTKYDTAATVPSGVTVYRGPFIPIHAGESKGAKVDYWQSNLAGVGGGNGATQCATHIGYQTNLGLLRRKWWTDSGWSPQNTPGVYTSTNETNIRRPLDNIVFPDRGRPLILRRGTGVALMGYNGGGWFAGTANNGFAATGQSNMIGSLHDCFDVEIDFTYIPKISAGYSFGG